MHQKPCYWTRQRIHNVAKLRGNLILIHNFGHCLVSATGSIFLECVLFMRSLAKDTNEHNVLISFLFIYINIYIYTSVYTCKNRIGVESQCGGRYNEVTTNLPYTRSKHTPVSHCYIFYSVRFLQCSPVPGSSMNV